MFNYNEYLINLFEQNPECDPHVLWDKTVQELTNEQKIQAFEENTGKGYLTTYRLNWLRRITAPDEVIAEYTVPTSPRSTPLRPSSAPRITTNAS